ncbi:MAG: hypothetical protein ACK4ZR_01190 [Aquificaceae bacterium]
MVRWILGLAVAFLLIDHIWVHFGGPFIERLRGEYREELKKATGDKAIELQQSYRKSLLDELWEKAKELVKGKKEEGGVK